MAIFEHSARILFDTEHGSGVTDNELFASRAQDLENKAYSDRKTGKDGPVADCIADSLICILLGMSTHFLLSCVFGTIICSLCFHHLLVHFSRYEVESNRRATANQCEYVDG